MWCREHEAAGGCPACAGWQRAKSAPTGKAVEYLMALNSCGRAPVSR